MELLVVEPVKDKVGVAAGAKNVLCRRIVHWSDQWNVGPAVNAGSQVEMKRGRGTRRVNAIFVKVVYIWCCRDNSSTAERRSFATVQQMSDVLKALYESLLVMLSTEQSSSAAAVGIQLVNVNETVLWQNSLRPDSADVVLA